MKKKRNILIVSLVAVAAALSAYFVLLTTSASSSPTSAPTVLGLGGETQPSSSLGPVATRPEGSPLAPGISLSAASPSAIAGGLQADLNDMLSGKVGTLAFDASTNGPIAGAFLQAEQPALRSVSITPTVVSSAPQPDGSLVVNFTVAVTVAGGLWPTNFGTLTATLEPQGTMMLSHGSLCELASAFTKTCPF